MGERKEKKNRTEGSGQGKRKEKERGPEQCRYGARECDELDGRRGGREKESTESFLGRGDHEIMI